MLAISLLLASCTATAWQVTAVTPDGTSCTFLHASRYIWEDPMRAGECRMADGDHLHWYDSEPESVLARISKPVEGLTGSISPVVPVTPVP